MKEDLLGLNHLVSFSATCHTVRPRSSALSSGHLRIAPPKSSSAMPKCFRYHAASAALSPLLLKKTPPTPVIFAIAALLFIKPPNGVRLSCGAQQKDWSAPLEADAHERTPTSGSMRRYCCWCARRTIPAAAGHRARCGLLL